MYCGEFNTKFGMVCGLTPGHPDDHACYRGRGAITRWRNESMSMCGQTNPEHPEYMCVVTGDHDIHYGAVGGIERAWRDVTESPPRCGCVGPLGWRCAKELTHTDPHHYQPFPDEAPDDPINHPTHYTHGPIEVIEVIEGFGLGYHLGNVVEYILRHEKKGGVEDLKDLKKARWYLDRYIEKAER